MPQAVAAVGNWIAQTVGNFVLAAATAAGASGFTATAAFNTAVYLTYGVSQIALYAGIQYAIDGVGRQKAAPQGAELQLRVDPDMAREMIIGERPTAGSLVARYSRGSNLYNAHFVYQLADHPCVELSRVYGDGRLVRDSALPHGTRTEITAYSYSGGARVWMTWHDGRPGQTADSDLVTKSAQDPDVVAGTIEGWTTDHRGAGCAYVHVEVQWDSDILTSIPQFLFHVKGAYLYDRRKDDTAGGSGDHRLDDPSTWEYSTNAAVANDHWMLGYQVEDDPLAFGIGLRKSEVPYAQFAALADLCDEDVETGEGDEAETIKRYAVNGIISAADFFQDVLEQFQNQMAARIVDLGGRIGILGAEERAVEVSLTEEDWISDEAVRFADKLPFSDLYGAITGSFPDPANLYEPTPYAKITTPYLALPDGGEATTAQLDLPWEVHPRRAVRLASAWLNRESLQPRLIGVFGPVAWKLEPGDWFEMTSARLQIEDEKFEVIDIIKNDDFTVLITARAIDPDFLAFDTDEDPDLSVPPAIDPVSLLLDEPEFEVEASELTAGDLVEPCLQFTLTSDETIAREILVEYGEWDGADIVGPTLIDSFHALQVVTKIRKGILPSLDYVIRAKTKAGPRESPWTDWSDPVTMGASYIVGEATSVPWSGVDDDDGHRPEDDSDVTSAHTAAAITGQTAWATEATPVDVVMRPGANMLFNSTFRLGFANWTKSEPDFILDTVAKCVTMPPGWVAGGGVAFFFSETFPVYDAVQHSLQCEFYTAGLSGSGAFVSCYVIWRDASNSEVGSRPTITQSVASDWTRLLLENITPPSGADKALVVCLISGDVVSAGCAWRRIKFEIGSHCTPYSDETTNGALIDALFSETYGFQSDSDLITVLGTASAITGQGAFALLSTAAYGSAYLTGFGALAPLGAVYFGSSLITETNGGSNATLSNFKTILGVASAITSQGALATLSTINSSGLIDSGVVVYTALAATAVRLGTNIVRADGSTSVTDSLVVTSLGTASAISGQGSFATLSAINSTLADANDLLRRSAGGLFTGELNADLTSGHTAAAFSGQTAWATFAPPTSILTQPGANLVFNSSFRLGLASWTRSNPVFTVDSVAKCITVPPPHTTSGAEYFYTAEIPVYEQAHSFQVEMYSAGLTGTMTCELIWRDAGGSEIGSRAVLTQTAAADWTRFTSENIAAPAGTAKIVIVGVITATVSGAGCAWRRIKVEAGAHCTPWSDETTNGALLSAVYSSTYGFQADADLITTLGTAAAIASQGGLATLSFVHFNSNVRLQDGTTVVTDATVVTASGTAAAISGQGSLATLNTAAAIAYATPSSTGLTTTYASVVSKTITLDGGKADIDFSALFNFGFPLISANGDTLEILLKLKRDSTTLVNDLVIGGWNTDGTNPTSISQLGAQFGYVDAPGAGSYTYSIELKANRNPNSGLHSAIMQADGARFRIINAKTGANTIT